MGEMFENLDECLNIKVKEYIKDNTQEIVNNILTEISKAYIRGFDEGADSILNYLKKEEE